jgi:hypothetical protein
MNWILAALLLVGAGQSPVPAPARDAKLIVTVTDQTQGVLPGATVTVTGLDAATKSAAPTVTHTADKGMVTVDNLAQGLYSVRIDMDGFNPTLIPDVRLAKGDNKRNVTMDLKSMSETVTVKRDQQIVAADRGSVTFGSALTREQIDALPDDPAELEKALRDMAGGDAIIRVDSFEGGKLPDKSQIKAIHISRDQFAAENHFAGGISIDIITQAGAGPFSMNGSYNVRDSSMDGRNALIGQRAPTRNQNYFFGGGGTLIPQKLSLNISGGVRRSFQEPLFNQQTPSGPVFALTGVRAPSTGFNSYAAMTYALTKDQTLRVYFSQSNNQDRLLGVGGYNSIERGYTQKSNFYSVRGQEAGPLGRRFVTNTKFSINWSDSVASAASDALTIVVNDAFTTGGAQRRGGRYTKEFLLQSDLDYVRGINTVRTGILTQGGNYRTDDASNYTGTYVFDSLNSYLANKPRSFTQRVGDPLIDYFNIQAGWYIQDDIRVRKNLSFSPGIRYEVQAHLRDYGAIGPRFGVTYAPFKNGKTSLRASWGIFYDWFTSGIYEQSLRVDGFQQQELTVTNPVFSATPDLSQATLTAKPTRYLVDPNLTMSRNQRLSAGIDQTITPRMRVSATYAYTQIGHAFRGENLNAPVNGVRPDPNFANVIRVVSDGAARQHTLSVNGSWLFAASSPQLQKARFNIRRGSLNLGYFTSRVRNNYDGPFTPPATGDIANEWGPSNGDIRSRLNFGVNTSALKNTNLNISLNASTGSPYNITAGTDTNGDLFFNDRPAGYSRNAGRGKGQYTVNANFSYNRTFGKARSGGSGGPQGIMISMVNGGPATVSTVAAPPGRYRMSIFVSAFNLTNHANPFGYVGNILAPNFGQATQLSGVRQINIGLNFGF